MRRLKTIFACMLMAIFSVGQVWATDFTLSSAASVTQDGITVSFAKGSGGTAPAWYAAGLRLYASNTVTITCDDDITDVTFNWEKQGSKAFASVTASTGSYTHPSAAGEGTWSGTAKSITFTLGSSGQLQLNTLSVTVDDGGSPQATLSVAPATIDFGTVEQNAVVADKTVAVTFANLTGSVTYDGLSSPFTASGSISATGDEITISANTENAGNYSQTLTVQSTADSKSQDVTVKMKVVAPLTPIAGGVVDELFVSDFGVTSGSYTAFTDKQASNGGHSDAVYAGTVARNGNATQYNIQLNSGQTSSKLREIATSTSGGYAKRVQAIWATQTANTANRKLTVYGSESAYTGSETLGTGTILGDLTYTAGDAYAYLDIDGDYPYIQIVANGAIYMDQINVTWVSSAAAVAKPAISGTENFLTSTEVSITCATEGATIYYTTNGSDPKESGSEYTGSFSLTESAHVQAIAKLGSDWSLYADKQFTKITPITVAAAIAAIPNQDDVVNDQYVSGIVCTAGTSVNASGQMTYYISDDGLETSRLQIYLGKNLDNTAFSAVSDLAMGDIVVVFGQLKNYKGTPEMNSGNYLVSKAAPAVAAPVFTPDGGGFMGETDVTITCATASSAIYYTLDGTAPSKSSTLYEGAIHLNATTTINAIAYVGDDASLVVSKTFTLTAPMTVAEALAALDSEDPINNAAVAGIISTAPTSNPSSGKLTYYISDDGSETDQLEVFLGYGLNGASFSAKTDLQEGDEVTVFGNLTIYNSTTKEFASGSRLLAFNRPAVAVTGVDLTESTAEVEVGKTVTLHASVVPANATNKTIVWSVQSGSDYASVENGVVTGIAAGEAVIRAASDENASIYEECTVTVTEPAPLSPWASIYTSNVTIASNEDKEVTIDGDDYPAAKTNKGTSATITLPQGVTTIHLHLVAWKGEAQTVTVSGDCFNADKNLTIIANDAVSGTAAKYDLGASGVDYYFSLTPDKAVAADEVITITAASNKRFVLFGVNQEGGVLPVLESIAISGDLDNKAYEAGAALDMTGLTVEATYSLGGTPQAPVDITDDAGLTWTYDPLVVDQTSVTVTANFGGQTDTKEITGLTVTDPTPRFETNPASYISFGSKVQGAEIAARDLEVSLINVAAASVLISGEGAAAFSVDEDALTGNATLHVSASSANVGTFAATLTISDDASEAADKEISLSLTVTAPEVPESAVSTTSEWVAATDADLVDGAEVLITGATGGVTYAMGAQGDNNRASEAGELSEGVFTPGENTMSFTLVAQEEEGVFALRTSNGKYLYAASSSKNYLKSQATVDGNAKWTITATSAVANGSNTHNDLKFNATNSPKIFSCYASGQTAIQFYVPKPAPAPVEDWVELRAGATSGKYYTTCLSKNVVNVRGGVFWNMSKRGTDIAYLEEAKVEELAAGKPFIFEVTGAKLEVVYEGAETSTAVPNGALRGTFSLMEQSDINDAADDESSDIYMLYNNHLYKANVAGQNSTIPANRAYVVYNDLQEITPVPAPGRRVKAMPMQPQEATGLDNIFDINADGAQKLILNGQLIIIREGKMYDTTGRVVK